MDHTKRVTCSRENRNTRLFSNALPLYFKVATRKPINNGGFVTTMALTLLPIFVFSGLCVLATVWFVEQKEKVQWMCETQNLAAQKTLVSAMRELLLLNPVVEGTVLEKKFVKLALAAAPTPMEKAALTAQLIAINLRLSALTAQQAALVLSTHIKAGQDLAHLRQKLQLHVSLMERLWRTRLNMHFSTTRPILRLRKKKIDPMGYLYLEHPLLAEQQAIRAQIVIFGERLFPKWLRWMTTQPLRWNESCISQPKKENEQWFAKIIMDKF